MRACTDFPDLPCVRDFTGCDPCRCYRTEDAELAKRPLERIMAEMPESWRNRWCEPGRLGCGCMGCANGSGGLSRWGFTKEQWEEWRAQRQP